MRRRNIQVGCDFTYVAAIATPAVFQVQPRESAGVVVEARGGGEPRGTRGYTDLYGNPCARAVLPAGRSSFRYQRRGGGTRRDRGRRRGPRRSCRPTPCPTTRCSTPCPAGTACRTCSGTRRGPLRRPAAGLPPGAGHLRPRARPPDLPVRQHDGAVHAPSTSTAAGRGVCRDFTHLAISFCRALNIPARYVFGYLPDMDVPPDPAPMDFAAWMEVWLGELVVDLRPAQQHAAARAGW